MVRPYMTVYRAHEASYRHRTDRGTRHNHYRYVGTAHAEPEGLGSDANIDLRMGMLYTHQRG